MSLLKVPFLVSVMGCMHATMTPPTHTPPKSEQLPATGLELVAPWFPYIPKVGHWTSRVAFLPLDSLNAPLIHVFFLVGHRFGPFHLRDHDHSRL